MLSVRHHHHRGKPPDTLTASSWQETLLLRQGQGQGIAVEGFPYGISQRLLKKNILLE